MRANTYRAIHFDLKIEKLKKYYSEKTPKKAYKLLRSFFEQKGFKHRQWSGYISQEKMSDADVLKLCNDLKVQFPWLENCIE